MQYTITHNGVTCNLPGLTRRIKKKLDDVNGQIMNADAPLDARVEALHRCLSELLGEDTVDKALGSGDLDEIDLNDMNILYLKVTREYDRPVKDFEKTELPAEYKQLLKDLDNAAKNITVINRMNNGK